MPCAFPTGVRHLSEREALYFPQAPKGYPCNGYSRDLTANTASCHWYGKRYEFDLAGGTIRVPNERAAREIYWLLRMLKANPLVYHGERQTSGFEIAWGHACPAP